MFYSNAPERDRREARGLPAKGIFRCGVQGCAVALNSAVIATRSTGSGSNARLSSHRRIGI